ncbi:hypothetical protein D3C83_114190 [compost metagenome]
MPGPGRQYLRFQGASCQCQISYNVEEFVPGGLILITEFNIIEYAFLLYGDLGLA